MTINRRWITLAGMALLASGALAHAQDPTIDPPDRVARISYVLGDVRLQPASGGDWQPAPLNRPLVASERLATTGTSLAELDLGSTVLRLGGTGELMLADGNATHPRFALPSGALTVTVRSLTPGATIEIDTDLVALLINHPGRYRVAASDVASVVQVTEGSIDAYGSTRAPMTLKAGQRYRFGAADFSKLAVSALPAADAFDRWSTTRDMRYNALATTQYVSQDLVGYQDLDSYGSWQQDTTLGPVWYPNDVAADWTPYGDGDWSFIAPWGWTWVDRQPWGFAPFHYGRWSHERGRWGWVPGPRSLHSTYAPAVVAFLGPDRSRPQPLRAGTTGWVALGPGEIYRPWFSASRGYFDRVNANGRPRNGETVDGAYQDWRRGNPASFGNLGNRAVPAAIASLPASSFPEIRAAQRAQTYGAGSVPQTVMPGAPPPPRPPLHTAGTVPFRVLQVPSRIVRTDPTPARNDTGASARPGLSFIAPEPGNMRQPPVAHVADSSPNTQPGPNFQQRQPQTVIRSDRGSYNGFQPSIDYARTPIQRPGYGGGNYHDRPPAQQAPVSQTVLQMPPKTSASAPARESAGRQAPARGDAPQGR